MKINCGFVHRTVSWILGHTVVSRTIHLLNELPTERRQVSRLIVSWRIRDHLITIENTFYYGNERSCTVLLC